MKTIACFIALLSGLAYGQNSGTIIIEKEDSAKKEIEIPKTPKKVRLSGLYYSDWVSDEIRTGNNVQFMQTRYFFYYSNYGEVYFFRSSGKPKKLAKSFEKNPTKYAEEVGHYEVTDGDLYMECNSLSSNKFYRYTGEANQKHMWLGMKAEYRKKVQLDLYLTKYVE